MELTPEQQAEKNQALAQLAADKIRREEARRTDRDPVPLDKSLMARGMAPPQRIPGLPEDRKISVPIDYSPEALQGEGDVVDAAKTVLGQIYQNWTDISNAARDTSVDLTRLADVCDKCVEKTIRASEKAVTDMTVKAAKIEEQINAALMPAQDPTLAAEIRAHWKGKKNSQNELITVFKDDIRTVSAVLSGPAYLSGLKSDQRELLRDAAIEHYVPDQGAKLKTALNSIERVQRGTQRLVDDLAPRIRGWRERVNPSLEALKKRAG